MKIVGLTGGIGSGKTTVANVFKELGVPVYIADNRAKTILATHPEVISEVKALLGLKAYQLSSEGNELPNKEFIAQKVFNDAALLKELNEIIHPRVRDDFNVFIKKQQYPYVIYEAAILLESCGNEICDLIILVTAPLTVRLERVMTRDKVTEEQVLNRVKNQWSEQEKLEFADIVIQNMDLHTTKGYVECIHRILLKK